MAMREEVLPAELEDLLEPYRIAFEASPVGMAFVTPDWRFVECNPALCRMLGRSEDELKGHSATEFTHPDDAEIHLPHQQRLLDGEIDDYAIEARYVHADGHAAWVSCHIGVLRGADGAIKLVIGLVEDIDERLRMREIHDRLLGLVLVGQGASGLAEELADVIESPVALLDGYGQPLASAAHSGREVTIPSREALEEDGALEGLHVHPLHLRDQVEGYLIAEEQSGEHDLAATAIEQAASSFALQLAMTRNAEEVESRLHGDLFEAMVSENPPDTASLVRWGRRLGHDLHAFTLIAFVRPVDVERAGGAAALTRLARTVSGIARESAPGSVAVPRGDALLVAVAAEDPAGARQIAGRMVERIASLAGTPVVVGLSRPVPSPAELANAQREARQAMDAALALPRLGPVAAFGELDLHNLLLGRSAPDAIERAARLTLAPLLEADERTRRRLIETLATYLDSVGQLEATSRRLGIHVNTLRQRIQRIEEALELNLQDARVRVNLQLALEVLGLDQPAS
jgi:PAS domain S-box-containing protein